MSKIERIVIEVDDKALADKRAAAKAAAKMQEAAEATRKGHLYTEWDGGGG